MVYSNVSNYVNVATPEAIGVRLKYLRRMSGLNRDEFSDKADIGTASLSLWENAKSHPMTPRSARKIVGAMYELGIKCDEKWLLAGIGFPPRIEIDVDNIPSHNEHLINITPVCNALSVEQANQLLKSEINAFLASTKLAVTTVVANYAMSPVFQKGDIIGGFWQPSTSLQNNTICILNIHHKLQIRRVTTTPHPNHFNLSFLAMDTHSNEPFELLNFPLSEAAPITRFWRL